jgi:hypothetical protein
MNHPYVFGSFRSCLCQADCDCLRMSPPYTQGLSVLQRGHLGFNKGRPVAAVLLYRYVFCFDKHSVSAIGSSEREGLAMGHRG